MGKRTGYIKLFRSVAKSELWTKEKFTRGQAWVDLLLLANFAPGHLRVRGNRVAIGRGQVGWSVERLAERWAWSKGKVNRFINELETERQIERQKSFVSTVLTITNYEAYQKMVRQTGQQTDGRQDSKQVDKRTADRPADGSADGSLRMKKEIIKQQQRKGEPVPTDAEPPSMTWEVVVVALKRAGVEMAEQAVETAKRNRNTPRDIMCLVEYFEANQNDPGMHPGILKNKVCSIHEGQKVTWPKSAVAQQQVAKAKTEDAQRQRVESRRIAAEQKAADKAEAERLEKIFGPELDSRSRADTKQFIRDTWPDRADFLIGQLPPKGPPAGSFRNHLLREIERRDEEAIA